MAEVLFCFERVVRGVRKLRSGWRGERKGWIERKGSLQRSATLEKKTPGGRSHRRIHIGILWVAERGAGSLYYWSR